MDSETTAQAIADMLTELPAESETEPAPAETRQTQPGNPGLIFPHQREVFRQLITTAKAFSKENWFGLPVIPRWHVLLIGSTGTGKSHLARALATQMGWGLYTAWSTRWIIAGGRGKETWGEIAQWLAAQPGKCIIFLDEAEKITGDDTWSRHLRVEIQQIFDRDLPPELTIDDSNSHESSQSLWAKAQMNLRCNTLLIGAGAFQNLWDHRPKSLGFGGDSPSKNIPTQQELKTVLPPELVNRFGQILALPPLGKQDYAEMARRTAAALPAEIRGKFIRQAEKHLTAAIENGRGARFVEECITAALLEDAQEKTPQKITVSRRRSISPQIP